MEDLARDSRSNHEETYQNLRKAYVDAAIMYVPVPGSHPQTALLPAAVGATAIRDSESVLRPVLR